MCLMNRIFHNQIKMMITLTLDIEIKKMPFEVFNNKLKLIHMGDDNKYNQNLDIIDVIVSLMKVNQEWMKFYPDLRQNTQKKFAEMNKIDKSCQHYYLAKWIYRQHSAWIFGDGYITKSGRRIKRPDRFKPTG